MTNMIATLITAVHLAALSQIESGDNDSAIGKNGEVSRYQITPELWRHCLTRAVEGKRCRAGLPTDTRLAQIVAYDIWESRAVVFKDREHRAPSPLEMYLLWHRPSRVMQPHKAERERAERFAAVYLKLKAETHSVGGQSK